MSSRHIRPIVAALLLTLGLGVPAQAKPLAAGAVLHGQGGVLEELTAYGASLLRALKDGSPWCGETGYCPTPPGPPPPGHTMSSIVKPHPAGKGSLP
jgi:hypothetical protein